MKVDWLNLWDDLEVRVREKNSWGKNEIIELMRDMEKKAIRLAEVHNEAN